MKFKLESKNTTKTAIFLGAALIGAMASDGVIGLLPTSTQGSLYKGGIAVATGAGAAAVQGSDTAATATKAGLLGASLKQVYNVVKTELAPKVVTTTNPTTVQKFVNNSFGMASAYKRRMPRMRSAALPANIWKRSTQKEFKPVQSTVSSII